MTREEIRNLILRRAYAGAFEEGTENTFNLHTYASESGIDNDEAWRAFEELRNEGLVDYNASEGIIVSTTAGLIYCERHKIVNEALIEYQNKVRKKQLVDLAYIQDKCPQGDIVDWEEWIREAGVNNQDFTNNDRILQDSGLVKMRNTSRLHNNATWARNRKGL